MRKTARSRCGLGQVRSWYWIGCASIVALWIGWGVCAEAADADAGAERPNVVFILADDWGWGDLSCHGNANVRTPNLDRLAKEGTEFAQFYVANPVCSPSRTGFMTGRYPARFGVHEAIGGPVKNREARQVDWLDPRAVMLPRVMKAAGYATGHYGKWHLCGPVDDAPLPAVYGVDEHAVWTGSPKMNATTFDKVFEEAIGFMTRHKDEPFYLNLWIHQTHAPQMPSKESLAEWANLDEQHRPYAAAVSDGDKGIGRVLAALSALKLEGRTIVVFSSDNGPEVTGREAQKELRGGYGTYYSTGSTGGMRGRKRSLYDGGVHLPFFVRWPGHVAAGRVNETTVLAAVDFLPTVCVATGVKPPEDWSGDGENLWDVCSGAERARGRALFWEWSGADKKPEYWPRFAVRDGEWKLLSDGKGRVELYGLPRDRAEAQEASKQNPEKTAALLEAVRVWRESLPKEPPADCITKSARGKARAGAGGAKEQEE